MSRVKILHRLLSSNLSQGEINGSLMLMEDNFKMSQVGKELGVVTDIGIIESDFVLWPLPGYFLRAQKGVMGPLELYSIGNMVRLGRFTSSLPPSGFFNLPHLSLLS